MSCRAAARDGVEIEVWAPRHRRDGNCVCSMAWRIPRHRRDVCVNRLDGVGAHAAPLYCSVGTHAGSSDPCAFLNLDGEKRKSRVVKKNINPQWMQTFRFPCDDGLNVTLQVDVEDYDFMGSV